MATNPPEQQTTPTPHHRRRYVIILGAAGILFLVFLGVWLLSPVHIDEVVSGTIKTNDVVQMLPGGIGKAVAINNLGTVKPGDVVSVEDGNVGFLLLQGGVTARLQGPASIKLVESRRQVDAPSVIQGILAQRAGTDPLGGTKVRTDLALDILSGTVAIKSGEAKANASFKLQAANLYSPIQGAAIQVTVLPVVNGLLFAFLDMRFQPWGGRGLQIFPMMLLGTSFAFMVDPIVRVWVLNRWGVSHHFGFNSANLFLGFSSVVVSRSFHLSPGLLIGNAGGLRIPALKDLPLARKSYLVVAGLVGTATVGFGAWFATLLLPLAASVPLTARVVQLFRGPLSTVQDICLLAFTGCLTKAFFNLLPVPHSPGLTVASKNLIGWFISFLISGFLFFHLILNKKSSTKTPGLLSFSRRGATCWYRWWYFRWRPRWLCTLHPRRWPRGPRLRPKRERRVRHGPHA